MKTNYFLNLIFMTIFLSFGCGGHKENAAEIQADTVSETLTEEEAETDTTAENQRNDDLKVIQCLESKLHYIENGQPDDLAEFAEKIYHASLECSADKKDLKNYALQIIEQHDERDDQEGE